MHELEALKARRQTPAHRCDQSDRRESCPCWQSPVIRGPRACWRVRRGRGLRGVLPSLSLAAFVAGVQRMNSGMEVIARGVFHIHTRLSNNSALIRAAQNEILSPRARVRRLGAGAVRGLGARGIRFEDVRCATKPDSAAALDGVSFLTLAQGPTRWPLVGTSGAGQSSIADLAHWALRPQPAGGS